MTQDLQYYCDLGLSIKAIAERVGMNEVVVRRLVGKGYVPTVPYDGPYGLTQETIKLRIRLGAKLYDLRERLDGNRTEVALLTGLNRYEQIAAEQRPYQHNWTLAQIERLAAAYSSTTKDLIDGSI